MPQVVQVNIGQVGCSPSCAPGGVDVMGAKRPAVTADEQRSGRQRRGTDLQVFGQC
jgi:hypothetical protein